MMRSGLQDFSGALHQVVALHGDRPAFRHEDHVLSYTDIGSAVEEKRIAYHAAGISNSSAVGVIADNPAEFLTDVFALLTLQTFVVLLASDTTHWELERLANSVRMSHILSTAPIAKSSAPVGRGRLLTRSDKEYTPILKGPALGFLTSGTTGHPKIALRTERAMLAEAVAMRDELELTPARRLAVMVPLHHSFGFGDCAFAGILAGVEISSYSRMPPSAYVATFERSEIDVVALVPAQLRLLAEACNRPVLSRLSVLSAGAPLDARTAQLANERLGCAIGQVYGTTETGVIAVARSGEGNASVGVPCHHVELRLDALPPDWRSGVPAASEEGVVAVRTEALFDGYVTRDDLDKEALRSGWFSTGDRARLVGGRLELLGRLSLAINVAGVKVSPEEVESALLEFPSVRAALVTGVDDSLAYQRIKAYVSPADIDLHELRRFCEARLSASKRPHYYEAVAALATTPSGKVLRGQRLGREGPR